MSQISYTKFLTDPGGAVRVVDGDAGEVETAADTAGHVRPEPP